MSVADLIEELRRYPQGVPVRIQFQSGKQRSIECLERSQTDMGLGVVIVVDQEPV